METLFGAVIWKLRYLIFLFKPISLRALLAVVMFWLEMWKKEIKFHCTYPDKLKVEIFATSVKYWKYFEIQLSVWLYDVEKKKSNLCKNN